MSSDGSVASEHLLITVVISTLTLLDGQQEGHPACKKPEWWDAGVVVCLQQAADLHIAQIMPLPLTVSCFCKIQVGFTFPVPAHLVSPGKRAVKRVCVLSFILLSSFAFSALTRLGGRKGIWHVKN